MSYVLATPAALASAASDVAGIGSSIHAVNAAAAARTTSVVAAAADEVSTQVATLFSSFAQEYQQVSGQAATFHEQFVLALRSGAGQYVAAEASAVQSLLGGANASAGTSALSAASALLRPAVSAASAAAAPAAVISVAFATSVKNLYYFIEPYVAYGASLAAYALGWLPYLGLLASQIYIVYALFEPMVQAGLFNILDWLSGVISFADGLNNFVAATAASINNFLYNEAYWFLGFLPPLPPLPPGLQ